MQSSDFGPIVSPLARYAKGGRHKKKGVIVEHSVTAAVPLHPGLAAQHQRGMAILGALAQHALAQKLKQALIARAIQQMSQQGAAPPVAGPQPPMGLG